MSTSEAIEIKTAPFDARFPNQNQTKYIKFSLQNSPFNLILISQGIAGKITLITIAVTRSRAKIMNHVNISREFTNRSVLMNG